MEQPGDVCTDWLIRLVSSAKAMSWQGKSSLRPTESAITAVVKIMKRERLSGQPCLMPEVLECFANAAPQSLTTNLTS